MEEQLFSIREDRDRKTPKGQMALLMLQAIHESKKEKCGEIREYIEIEECWVKKEYLENRGERKSPESRPGNRTWTTWLCDTATDARSKGLFEPLDEIWRIADPVLADIVRRELIEELREIGYVDWLIVSQDFYDRVTSFQGGTL